MDRAVAGAGLLAALDPNLSPKGAPPPLRDPHEGDDVTNETVWEDNLRPDAAARV